MDYSPPGSSVHGISQARILEWVAISLCVCVCVCVCVTEYMYNGILGFPGGSDGKESTCNVGDLGLIPGLGRSPGEGNDNPLQYFCPENAMDKET